MASSGVLVSKSLPGWGDVCAAWEMTSRMAWESRSQRGLRRRYRCLALLHQWLDQKGHCSHL